MTQLFTVQYYLLTEDIPLAADSSTKNLFSGYHMSSEHSGNCTVGTPILLTGKVTFRAIQ